MRTAHLVVSGMAFAVWTAASVIYFTMCENTSTGYWWLLGPAAALPAFGCVYAWFASRRADPTTTRWLTYLAVPVLVMGLGMLLVVIADSTAEHPGGGGGRPIGMGTAMIAQGCWGLAAPCGLSSFVLALNLQIKRLRQLRDES